MLLDEPDLVKPLHSLSEGLQPGSYGWRTATIDHSGEKGPFGDVEPFEVLKIPESPAMEEPSLNDDGLRLAWSSSPGAEKYEFQLADSDTFENLIHNTTTEHTQVFLKDLKPDQYYFRVRGISEEGVSGPFASVHTVKIPGPPIWPLKVFGGALFFILL